MKEYSTKQAAGVQKIETLGGDYALKWEYETQMSLNAYAAFKRCQKGTEFGNNLQKPGFHP